MLKRFSFLAICIAALGFKSCQTEFSVNGAYEITPVVMGLLDHGDSVHIIKITKAFLGDGDNLVYAKEPDSNYFQNVDARVIEYEGDGETKTGREWQLQDSMVSNKDTDGIFYAPEQKIYYFEANDLNEEYQYEIVADLDEGAHSFNAKTGMINGFSISSPAVFSSDRINFNGATVNGDDDYKAYKFTVNEALNAGLYNYKYIFRWREYYLDGSSQDFELERIDKDVTQEVPQQANSHSAFFHGLEFFRWLGGYENTAGQQQPGVITYDENVDRRMVLGIDIRISIAHSDLVQFMEVTKPQTGIAQSQPEFTNINGGLGLFSSRHIYELKNYRLSTNSMKELCQGQYTATLQFCSQFPEDASESYACP
ncbi:MAG: hypothetical protein MI810_14290 [Flavobacteriales bacterium]|nr:hypothetical protein [Flavobacteriales bacterium]